MEYYLAIKKNEILPLATIWMKLRDIMPSEIVRERQIYHFTHMWNSRDKTNEQTKKKHTPKYRERTGGCQRGGGEDEQNR